MTSPETHTATTTDGWKLRLLHYHPQTSTTNPTPVILCHGLAANKNSCDFGEPDTPHWHRYSLAAYLTTTSPSFDVWVPELRGNGTPFYDPHQHPEKYRWSVDDYVDHDIPAIIATVQKYHREKDGQKRPVFWVGKSMGGMIAYAYGETPDGQHKLKGVVTLGSPVVFAKTGVLLEFVTRIMPRNLAVPIHLPDLVLKNQDLRQLVTRMAANPENIDPIVWQYYLKNGHQQVLSSKVANQFSLFFRHRTFCRYPRRPWVYDTVGRLPGLKKMFAPYSYTEHLKDFTAPLLAIAGGHDQLGPPADIQYVTAHVGSTDVTYLELSKKNGFTADYGHLDLNLGLHARDEVYPRIGQWIRDRDHP